MDKEMNNDLIVVLNEIREARKQMEGGDIWEADNRLENAESWLLKYVNFDDKLQEI